MGGNGRTTAALAACLVAVLNWACDSPRVIDELPPPAGPPPTATRLDEDLQALAALGYWGDYLVQDRGEVILHRGYGWRDRNERLPINNHTVFDVGSIAKVFTSALILDLVESGDLRLDEPLAKALVDVPPDKAGITVRQLLTHTSGLATYHDEGVGHLDRTGALRRILKSPLKRPPGSGYSYSNSGYTLLAIIAETVTGDDFTRLVEQRILAPASMSMTGWQGDEQWRTDGAVGYYAGREGTNVADLDASWTVQGAGTIVSTPGDLLKLDAALKTGVILDSATSVAMRSTWDGVMTPARLDDAGMGWRVWKSPRQGVVLEKSGHTGNDAFNAVFRRYLDEDRVVIVCLNTEDFSLGGLGSGTWLASRIHGYLSGWNQDPPPHPRNGALLVPNVDGTYRSSAGTATIHHVEGRTLLEARGQALVNSLLRIPGSAADDLEAANVRARVLLQAFRVGPPPDSLLFPGLGDYLHGELEGWFRPSGVLFDSLEITGSTPEWLQDTDGITTYLRARFDGDWRARRIHWDGRGRLLGVGGSALGEPVLDLLVEGQDGQLVAHHLALGRSVPLALVGTTLTVGEGDAAVNLERTIARTRTGGGPWRGRE